MADRFELPESLAATMSGGEADCPLPATHDRRNECHYWWHEMARNYHEPNQFRWSVGAFIQAARNVTWMLQSEKDLFEDFAWYEDEGEGWRARARRIAELQWLNETRVHLTKRGALSAQSEVMLRCLRGGEDDDPRPARGAVSPFICTHALIRMGPAEDHPHEFERTWRLIGLEDVEALEACAVIYDLLDEVVELAHEKLGSGLQLMDDGEPVERSGRHRLPCMDDLRPHRIVRTTMTEQGEVWIGDQTNAH